MMHYQDQDSGKTVTPIYCAAMDWARANPRWWSETREATCATQIHDNESLLSVLSDVKPPFIVHVDTRNGKQSIRLTGAWNQVLMYGVNGASVPLVNVKTADGAVFTPIGKIVNGCFIVKIKGALNTTVTVRVVTLK